MTAPEYPQILPLWVTVPALIVGVVVMFTAVPIFFQLRKGWARALALTIGVVVAVAGIGVGGYCVSEGTKARSEFQAGFAQYAALHAGLGIDSGDIPFPDEQAEARLTATRRDGSHTVVKLVRDGRTWKVYELKEAAARVG
jgi:hypothetical protein